MSTDFYVRQSKQKRDALNSGLNVRAEKARQKQRRAFERKQREKAAKPARMIAYDFETGRIKAGTPRPLYITAFSPPESPAGEFCVDSPISNMDHLTALLEAQFLTEENRGVKFVAWNGNRFDAYFIAAALVHSGAYVLRPYLTRSHALRGLRVSRAGDGKAAKSWEFLDGIAMLGLEGVTLEKLLLNFAPNHAKLTGVVDFENGEEFDPNNAKHREYAMRDSVGLYYAMERAQQIMIDNFDQPLGVTMGGACIKIFQANIPRGVDVNALDPSAEVAFREYVMRGGYCYCARRYQGPVWKYDLNQAYAAAMREDDMPCGGVIYNPNGVHASAKCYVAQVEAFNPNNKIPFYYRTEVAGRIKSQFAMDHIAPTWLTSVEVSQLRAEGWRVKVFGAYQWHESFTMREFVDRLELLRTTCEGGPSGPIGTMVKATGNHAYGKTVAQDAAIEFLISSTQPDEYEPFFDDKNTRVENVWFHLDDNQRAKEYHAVQIGAFITASVRMKVRRAALLAPDSWLYADTDCVIFDSDVTAQLDIDPKRYGAWKIEESGAEFQIIAKKVYTEVVAPQAKPKKRSAKGLNVKKLTGDDFARWFNGSPPTQDQVQRNNFLIVMDGMDMFKNQRRRGTAVAVSAPSAP
ncbi:MAG: DNA polymerase [Fluviibacter sp.]